jgi:hypothetical protein
MGTSAKCATGPRAVEYRVEQHEDKLRDRLPLLRQTLAESKVVSPLGG